MFVLCNWKLLSWNSTIGSIFNLLFLLMELIPNWPNQIHYRVVPIFPSSRTAPSKAPANAAAITINHAFPSLLNGRKKALLFSAWITTLILSFLFRFSSFSLRPPPPNSPSVLTPNPGDQRACNCQILTVLSHVLFCSLSKISWRKLSSCQLTVKLFNVLSPPSSARTRSS